MLCYTSDPLEEDMEVTGPVIVKLFASTDGRDTDFTAKLVDVAPDGYAVNLCDGILRGRYRESMERQELLEPGTVYEFTIDLWPTSNVFKKGHRIRVDISSSNFPRFDRNPNTGNKFGQDAELRVAHQQVFHEGARIPHHPAGDPQRLTVHRKTMRRFADSLALFWRCAASYNFNPVDVQSWAA